MMFKTVYTQQVLIILSFWMILMGKLAGEEPWRFINLADWHWAEKYIFGPSQDWGPPAIETDIKTLKAIKSQYGGEFILLPGDSNGGHWDRPNFIKQFNPGGTPEEAILGAGKLCYEGMIDSFKKGGYSKLIMAVGDHEMGDNPWPAGSDVARCQPQFREAFAKAFNYSTDGGGFKYTKPIGSANSRPLGTKYEDTSFAYRHKNALFITVDAFHIEDYNKKIGHEGAVTGTVTGEHLIWVEDVLREARKDESIRHIIVQSHIPVLYPVRKVSSSGMLMDDGEENPFWRLLRKYNVDLYFAGEVHANTVTKDSQSNLIQVVTRGNFFNNFQTVDLFEDKIEMVLYRQATQVVSEGKYKETGHLLIDKSGGKTKLESEGGLALLDRQDAMFHFSFEEEYPFAKRAINGLEYRLKGKKGIENKIRGTICTQLIPNEGAFGSQYDAFHSSVLFEEGKKGKAAVMNDQSRIACWAMGPHQGEHAMSYGLWVKTVSTGRQVLVNSGSIWTNKAVNFFNLNLNAGIPEVMISDKISLQAETEALNDGEWHHLAAVMPRSGCSISDVEIYVDGIQVPTQLSGMDKKIFMVNSSRVSIGGFGYSSKVFDKMGVSPLNGSVDEVKIWTRSLSPDEVKASM